jgi:hypothetical protein
MFKLFKPKAPEPQTVFAHLVSCLTPEDCRSGYEEPLQQMLTAGGLGTITRSGPGLDGDTRVSFNEIEMRLTAPDATVLDRVVALFDSQGAPKGSWLHDAEGKVLRQFGTTEVMVLELDTATVPPPVQASHSVADLVAEISTLISHAGRCKGSRVFAQTTELYFHCRGTKSVEAVLVRVMESHPLCQNARAFRLAVPA